MAEEFGEEEVWYCGVEMKEDSSGSSFRKGKNLSTASSCKSWGLSSAPRLVPKTRNHSEKGPETMKINGTRSSAPVDIPDWSRIYGKSGNSRNGYHVSDDGGHQDHVHDDDDDEEEEEEDGDDGMLPPHEWLSKKLARTKISSFSMCEGIGRTLKGRDLSRVRNAVLTKTGFLE